MFDNLTRPNQYIADFRKPFDPTNLPIFKRFETGYAIFIVLNIPNCLAKLTSVETGKHTGIHYSKKYKDLITSYVKILEREFTGLDGLDNITSESVEYEGNNEMSVSAINKTIESTSATISIQYTEQYGATLTRVHELFLKGVDDPILGRRKHYNGLIDDKELMPAFENEVFTFLYMLTDNTGYRLEKAFYLFNAQPIVSHLSELYNSEAGVRANKEITCEFNCNVATGNVINAKAKTILEALTGVAVEDVDGEISVSQKYKGIIVHDSDIKANTDPIYKSGLDYNYVAPKAIIGNKDGLGHLNNSGDQMSALVRQLNGSYEYNRYTNSGSDSIDSFGNAVNSDFSGSTEANSPIETDITFDSPTLKVGDRVYIKPGTTGRNTSNVVTKPATSSTTIDNWTSASVEYILSRSTAKIHAKQKSTKVVYGASDVYAYKMKLSNGEVWWFRSTDVYKYKNGNLLNGLSGKKYNGNKGYPVIGGPKYAVGDWVILKSTKLQNIIYERTGEADKIDDDGGYAEDAKIQYTVAVTVPLLVKISYVTSARVAQAIANDSQNSDVYGTRHVYGIFTDDTSHKMLYFRESDVQKKFTDVKNMDSASSVAPIIVHWSEDRFFKLPKNADTMDKFLALVENDGGLPRLSEAEMKGWLTTDT